MHDGPKVHTGPFSHTMRIERLGLENAKKSLGKTSNSRQLCDVGGYSGSGKKEEVCQVKRKIRDAGKHYTTVPKKRREMGKLRESECEKCISARENISRMNS